MAEEVKKKGAIVSVESKVDDESKVIWSAKHDAFVLAFKCAGNWYCQWLVWSCRGGRPKYFWALVDLYRHVRRNRLSSKSLRALAH